MNHATPITMATTINTRIIFLIFITLPGKFAVLSTATNHTKNFKNNSIYLFLINFSKLKTKLSKKRISTPNKQLAYKHMQTNTVLPALNGSSTNHPQKQGTSIHTLPPTSKPSPAPAHHPHTPHAAQASTAAK